MCKVKKIVVHVKRLLAFLSLVLATILLSVGMSAALLANDCPSLNIRDILNDQVVKGALDDAWNDSQPHDTRNRHEEGGYIWHCEDGGVYTTQIQRSRRGTTDAIVLGTPVSPKQNSCRLVASFHIHPGNELNGYIPSEPSGADLLVSEQLGIPGIIRYRTRDIVDPRDLTHGACEGYQADTENPSMGTCERFHYEARAPLWECNPPYAQGSSHGEPHLLTFDGESILFPAVGEFVIAKSLEGDFEIQTRQSRFNQSKIIDVNTAVAMRYLGDKISVYVTPSSVFIGGNRYAPQLGDEILPNGTSVSVKDRIISISTPKGDKVEIDRWPKNLNCKIILAPERRGKMQGLLGDFDGRKSNDIKTREGWTIDLTRDIWFNKEYKMWGNSWRVKQDESLFDYDEGKTTADYTDPEFPDYSGDNRSTKNKDVARKACIDAGIDSQPYLDDCIYDYSMTEDDSFIEQIAYLQADTFSKKFSFPSFNDLSKLAFSGQPQRTPALRQGQFILASMTDTWGNVYYKHKVSVINGFETAFIFSCEPQEQHDSNKGDGLTLILRNSLGSLSTVFGNISIKKSKVQGESTSGQLHIRLATRKDFDDISDNHLTVSYLPGPIYTYVGKDKIFLARTDRISKLTDGAPHLVKVIYEKQVMKIFLDDLSSPLLEFSLILEDKIKTYDGKMWIGIEARNGARKQNNIIHNWQFISF